MQGGTFEQGVSKERAGIYFRFYSAAEERAKIGNRGVALLPLSLNWGEPKKFLEISTPEDVQQIFGTKIDDPVLFMVKEAKKNASKVKVYRVNEGNKATATIGEMKVEALFGGTKGNEITIVISTNILDSTKKDVSTYVNGMRVNLQTVSKIDELKANKWVAFSGTGDLTNTAGTVLEGGTNGTPTNQDYMDFFAAAEGEHFDTVGLPVDEEQLKASFVAFIRKVRDEQGRKVKGVLANYPADYEGIDNVRNGVVLDNGEILTPDKAVAWATGASAGASVTVSNTFKEYEGAVDAYPRLSDYEVIEGIRNGEYIFVYDMIDKVVSVEKDINSLTTFTEEKNKRFAKNRVLRVLDGINNDLTRELKIAIKEAKERGVDISVNDDGAAFVKILCTTYMKALQDLGGIKNFDSQADILVTVHDDDSFDIGIWAQPVDSAEKFYFNVGVK
ncbi:phage tail sheath family protein [Heyndrickxia oleronia]|uniref:phage tail sheath family protein n=1 Tax=Heyndrickxia oleronia TaxID=38875 RepID=UPI003F845CD2